MIAAEERNGLSVEAAFDALRLYARDQNIKLTDLAAGVVYNNFNPQVPLGPRGTGRPVAPCEELRRLERHLPRARFEAKLLTAARRESSEHRDGR